MSKWYGNTTWTNSIATEAVYCILKVVKELTALTKYLNNRNTDSCR